MDFAVIVQIPCFFSMLCRNSATGATLLTKQSRNGEIGFYNAMKELKSYFGSKPWANEQLRYAIRVLKGEAGSSGCRVWNGNLFLALYLKDRLLELGFPWQAARIENWIHRLQPSRADSAAEEAEEVHSGGIQPIATSTHAWRMEKENTKQAKNTRVFTPPDHHGNEDRPQKEWKLRTSGILHQKSESIGEMASEKSAAQTLENFHRRLTFDPGIDAKREAP